MNNSIGMCGLDFIEFSSLQPQRLEQLFVAFGFSKLNKHQKRNVDYFKQNDIHIFLNREARGYARQFTEQHGPALCSMGWRFENPQKAYEMALKNGATPAQGELHLKNGTPVPAILGIGDMLIYFVDKNIHQQQYADLGFAKHPEAIEVAPKGFLVIDHLTNNVEKGTLKKWAEFYKNIFGFSEVRYFDIRGAQTGLTSFALRSPCGQFCIPINEGSEKKSQINEYLEEYKGPGVQHLAFLTDDILSSLDALQNSKIQMLDMDDEYYQDVFKKFPNVIENHDRIRQHQVLIDGDEHGYLLQIFTKNIIGPIFIEIIQRHNHYSFGEGNFAALFRSIERDQMKRGYLPP